MAALPRQHIKRVIGRIDVETRGRLDTALLIVLGLTH
jgi:hypothetical protein